MRSMLRRCGLAAVVGAVVLMAGCSVNGGGWLASFYGPGKVTLSLNGKIDTTNETITGQGELHDQAVNVDAHLVVAPVDVDETEFQDLVIDATEFFNVNPDAGNPFYLQGTYTPQPANAGPGGAFQAFVLDDPTPGNKGQGDFVVVQFQGGVYDGYTAVGFLQGGNFTVKN